MNPSVEDHKKDFIMYFLVKYDKFSCDSFIVEKSEKVEKGKNEKNGEKVEKVQKN